MEMDNADEWIVDEGSRIHQLAGDFVRIVKYAHTTPSQNETRHMAYMSSTARERLGGAEFIQLLMKPDGWNSMLRLNPCSISTQGAKRLSTKAKTSRIRGAERIIERYKMPCGYYTYAEEKQAYVLNRDIT